MISSSINDRKNVGGGSSRSIVIVAVLLCIVVLSLSNLQVFNAKQLSKFVTLSFGVYDNNNKVKATDNDNSDEYEARIQLIRQRQKQAAAITTITQIEESRTVNNNNNDNDDDNMINIDYEDPIIQEFLNKHRRNNNNNSTTITTSSSSSSSNSTLPQIYQNYFLWHYTQLKQIQSNPSLVYNSKKFKFIIMECHYKGKGYERNGVGGQCGGISDRLTALPMLLFLAAINKRILFISWTRPFGLEEYLQPPSSANGLVLDWRIPDYLYNAIYNNNNHNNNNNNIGDDANDGDNATNNNTDDIVTAAEVENTSASTLSSILLLNEKQAVVYMKSNTPVIRTKLQQMQSDGNDILTKLSNNKFNYDKNNLYSIIWRSMFEPTLRLQTKITNQLTQHNIQSGKYSIAHIRNIYPPINLEYDVVYKRTLRGLKCASQLYPSAPILVVTDHKVSNIVAKNISSKLGGNDIIQIEIMDDDDDIDDEDSTTIINNNNTTRQKKTELLHFDHDPLWKSRKPEEYDKVFLDLYMLAESKCVAYGKGGYGKFGMRLSYGYNNDGNNEKGGVKCAINHQTQRPFIPCQWNLRNGTAFGHFGMRR